MSKRQCALLKFRFLLSEWYTVQLLLSTNVEHCSTCWNIVVPVEYSFNFCWSTTTHFGAKLKWQTRKYCLLSLCALSVVFFKATGELTINEEEKSWRQQIAGQTITWTSRDLLTRSSEFCCNLYPSFVYHVTIFVILRSYIVQARKSLVQIDQLTGAIKPAIELCCFQLFGRYVDNSTKPRDIKLQTRKRLVEAVQQAATCWTE